MHAHVKCAAEPELLRRVNLVLVEGEIDHEKDVCEPHTLQDPHLRWGCKRVNMCVCVCGVCVVRVCMGIMVRMCMYVCVCVRVRMRQRVRKKQRETEAERKKQRKYMGTCFCVPVCVCLCAHLRVVYICCCAYVDIRVLDCAGCVLTTNIPSFITLAMKYTVQKRVMTAVQNQNTPKRMWASEHARARTQTHRHIQTDARHTNTQTSDL